MKTGISVACREEDLRESISECLLILKTLDRITVDLKVTFYLEPEPGRQDSAWRYITIHQDSRVDDVLEIYELKKQMNPDNYFTLKP